MREDETSKSEGMADAKATEGSACDGGVQFRRRAGMGLSGGAGIHDGGRSHTELQPIDRLLEKDGVATAATDREAAGQGNQIQRLGDIVDKLTAAGFQIEEDPEAEKRELENRRHMEFGEFVVPEYCMPVDRGNEKVDWEMWDAVQGWNPAKGLLLRGGSGIGKTRALFHKLRDWYVKTGIKPKYLPYWQLEQAAQDARWAGRGEEYMRELIMFRGPLVIDDADKLHSREDQMGRQTMTLLFSLIEGRTAWQRPLVLIVNEAFGQMADKMQHGMDQSFIRRLKEPRFFEQIISTW